MGSRDGLMTSRAGHLIVPQMTFQQGNLLTGIVADERVNHHRVDQMGMLVVCLISYDFTLFSTIQGMYEFWRELLSRQFD